MAAVLAELPPRSSLLPLVADHTKHGRVPVYRHFALWHTIEQDGRVPALFSGNGFGDHLKHFWIAAPLYYPGDHWGKGEYPPLAWERIRSQYEFILQAGRDHRARTMIVEHADSVAARGAITLYRIRGH